MKYFLDSAKIEEIRYADQTFGIDGITTNPRHIQLSGKPFMTVVKELATEFKDRQNFPISVELNPHLDDVAEIVTQGKEIAQLSDNFIIKVPCTEAGIVAAKKLELQGIKTNVTLVFSPSQAIIAAKVGATFVSPFVGWKENSGDDALAYIADIVKIYRQFDYQTEIIVAAVRNGYQIAQAAQLGADIVTCGLDVYQNSFAHPFTDYGLNVFCDAWDKTVKE